MEDALLANLLGQKFDLNFECISSEKSIAPFPENDISFKEMMNYLEEYCQSNNFNMIRTTEKLEDSKAEDFSLLGTRHAYFCITDKANHIVCSCSIEIWNDDKKPHLVVYQTMHGKK